MYISHRYPQNCVRILISTDAHMADTYSLCWWRNAQTRVPFCGCLFTYTKDHKHKPRWNLKERWRNIQCRNPVDKNIETPNMKNSLFNLIITMLCLLLWSCLICALGVSGVDHLSPVLGHQLDQTWQQQTPNVTPLWIHNAHTLHIYVHLWSQRALGLLYLHTSHYFQHFRGCKFTAIHK